MGVCTRLYTCVSCSQTTHRLYTLHTIVVRDFFFFREARVGELYIARERGLVVINFTRVLFVLYVYILYSERAREKDAIASDWEKGKKSFVLFAKSLVV